MAGLAANTVSVVIPVLNGERFVRDAIDSVLAQIGVSTQVIVVDNGSTDGTREAVRAKYENSLVLLDEPRPGAAHARNTGVRAATGEYLAFLDADDIWLPGKLQRQLAELNSRPEIDMVFCHGQDFHSPELTGAEKSVAVCRPAPYPWIAPSAFLCRRETFLRVGDFPGAPAGEFIAWYGWAQSLGLNTSVIAEVLFHRRIHLANSTRDPRLHAGYLLAAKWLLDQRREAQRIAEA